VIHLRKLNTNNVRGERGMGVCDEKEEMERKTDQRNAPGSKKKRRNANE
jgi:hypothetical protein